MIHSSLSISLHPILAKYFKIADEIKDAMNFLQRVKTNKNVTYMHYIPSRLKFSILPLSPQNAWVGFQFLVQTVGVGRTRWGKTSVEKFSGFRNLGLEEGRAHSGV